MNQPFTETLSATPPHLDEIRVRLKMAWQAASPSGTLPRIEDQLGGLVEASGDRVLGFAMIGPDAGEVLAAVQTAMLGGLPYTVLRDAILTHPTMAEGLNTLFAAIPGR